MARDVVTSEDLAELYTFTWRGASWVEHPRGIAEAVAEVAVLGNVQQNAQTRANRATRVLS